METYGSEVGSSHRLHSTEARAPKAGWSSPLTHPLWWIALAILVVNDFVLKRSSLAGAVTGKLSDFAGLIVAPVLVASIVRPKTRAGRLACFASVAFPFVAIKVSAKAASLLVWAASLCGLTWRIWSDWTDVAALGVLPLAWRISQGKRARDERLFPAGVAVHRVGVVLGALACVATSQEFTEIETAAYLVNMTPHEVKVSIFRPQAAPDCAALVADPHAMLRSEQFVFDRCWTAAAAELVPLDQDWRKVLDDGGSPDAASPRACEAFVIRVAGMPDTAVFWNQISKVRIGTVGVDSLDPHALLLERFGDSFVVERTPLLDVWPVDLPLPEVTGACEYAP